MANSVGVWGGFQNITGQGAPAAPTSSGSGSTSSDGSTPPSTPDLPGLSSDQVAALTGDERNAYQAVYSTLQQYGLESLASVLYSYEVQGFDSSTVNYLIQQTPEWQQRFQGNTLLQKQGLAPLSPSDYLATEAQYKTVLKAAGIPTSLYGNSDFAQWIGNSVSPSEIQGRAQIAEQWVNNNDSYFLQALNDYHGISKGDMIAYALDQNRTLPYLNLVSQQAQVGAGALRAGLKAAPDFAMQLANMVQNGDLTTAGVDQGYSQIAQELPRLHDLGQLAKTPFNQQTAEQATLLGNAAAQRTQLGIVQQEQARFAGTPGLGSNFYHPAYGLGRDMEGAF